jgi:hypothetical protein
MELKRQAGVCNKVLLWRKRQSMGKMYVALGTSCLESKRLWRTEAKVVRQWMLGVMVKAWAEWSEMGQAQSRCRLFEEEGSSYYQQLVMSVVQTALLSLSKCFCCWSVYTSDQRRLVLMAETIVRRWRHRTITAVYLKWRERMLVRKRLGFVETLVTCLLQNIQTTITVRLMEDMFMTWCTPSTFKQEHELVFVQGLAALSTLVTDTRSSRRDFKVGQAMHRGQQKALGLVLECWYENHVQLLMQYHQSSRIPMRRKSGAKTVAWLNWYQAYATARSSSFREHKELVR